MLGPRLNEVAGTGAWGKEFPTSSAASTGFSEEELVAGVDAN